MRFQRLGRAADAVGGLGNVSARQHEICHPIGQRRSDRDGCGQVLDACASPAFSRTNSHDAAEVAKYVGSVGGVQLLEQRGVRPP